MNRLIAAISVVLVGILSCSEEDPDFGPRLVDFSVVFSSTFGGDHEDPGFAVVRTESEMNKTWAEVMGSGVNQPSIDFTTDQGVFIFLGSRPTTGFEIEVLSVTEYSGTVEITITEHAPQDGAGHAISEPFTLISFRKIKKGISLTKEQ